VPVELPHGSWPSPITADLVVAGSVGLSDVRAGGDDVWWAELRPDDGGRVVIVRHAPGGGTFDLLPPGFSARTRVHEYGGGAWWVHDETLFFANWSDQRVYRVEPDPDPDLDPEPGTAGWPVPLTPPPSVPQADRYADGTLTADGRWVLCVRERHGVGEATNEIVAFDAVAGGEPAVVVSGPDFVAAPRVSPDGRSICWLQWNHPDMPWGGTELWRATLSSGADGCSISAPRLVAGSRNESITQPEWHVDGRLWFVSDRSDWWNLYRAPADGSSPVEAIVPIRGEIGTPAWVFGQSRYAFLADGRIAVAYAADGTDHLAVLDPTAGAGDQVTDVDSGCSAISSVRAYGNGIVFVGGSATAEPVIAVGDLPRHGDATIGVVRAPRDLGIGPEWFSTPQPIEIETTGGAVTHALVYAPTNPDVVGPHGSAPPLIVMSHGGPTSAARPQLSLALQYWTSRGFAVVDVNYRGSTGYGRQYRSALAGQWGVADVDDCVAAADHLVADGRADPGRLAIRGGSAGGYTTLCALAFRDRFQAGASLYGIADLEALARDTHKFESRDLDSLVGPYPDQRDLYVERSPINHVDGFDCALIVLQGLEDEIVPPAQSEMIVAAVRAKGLPVAYVAFEGEQHGFRMAASIKRALEAELYFFAQVFGFELAEPIDPVPIDNL
jgi:dipeptidyl aminopeptidase/acylaminoacyl peptidase